MGAGPGNICGSGKVYVWYGVWFMNSYHAREKIIITFCRLISFLQERRHNSTQVEHKVAPCAYPRWCGSFVQLVSDLQIINDSIYMRSVECRSESFTQNARMFDSE